MNSGDRSLEEGPCVVTNAFPYISLIVLSHFYWFNDGRSLSSVGGLRGSFKEIYVERIIA